jgi:membrane protein
MSADEETGAGADTRREESAGWRERLNAAVGRVTATPPVSRGLAVLETGNEAGATLFSATLAFSTLFAVIPLLLLLSGLLGWVVDDAAERQALMDQLVSYVPPLADVMERTLAGAVRERGALSIVGLVGLLWGASAFYGGLDEVMRRLFPGGGVRGQVSRRIRGVVTVVVLVGLIIGTVSLSGVWALVDQLVGNLAVWRYAVPALALAVMVLVVLAVYLLVPTRPPNWRAALPPAITAGIGIGLLTNLFGLLAPLLIGGLSGLGVLATVFGALVWLNFSYQILLYGAAWARLRRDDAEARSRMAAA